MSELDEALAALKLRDEEVAWLERELENVTEGRRVKLRSTANERAWLLATKPTSVNATAYTQVLDLAESLEAARNQLLVTIASLEGEVALYRERLACIVADAGDNLGAHNAAVGVLDAGDAYRASKRGIGC